MKYNIEDSAFNVMYDHLRCERNIHTGDKEKIRLFLEAIFWMARSGAQWRFLPEWYGGWNGVYQKFERWSELGIWKRMFLHFSKDKDMEWLMIDSTIVRAHACAAGAKGGSKSKDLDAARVALAQKYI